MCVSVPEITAFDLIRYVKPVGHLSHVATVLCELQEKLDTKHLEHILATENLELPYVQRLGYLLQFLEANQEIVLLLKQWIKKQKPHAIPLRSDKDYEKSQRNTDWYLYINEKIETDI
jgi:hypothetical protein